jgi:hypothetical protein
MKMILKVLDLNVESMEFWVIFVIENSIKFKKMGLEGNVSFGNQFALGITSNVTLVGMTFETLH